MTTARIFTLYSDGVELWSRIPHPMPAVWDAPFILTVKARSIREAYWLAYNRKRLQVATGIGIEEVDHRDGPEAAQKFFRAGGR